MTLFKIIMIISLCASLAGLWKIFEKTGNKGWYVLIPFYNLYIWLKIIKKPMWWFALIIIPFFGFFMIMLMIVELVKCFNKFKLGEQALSVVFPFAYLPYLGFTEKEKYVHPDKRPEFKKTVVREWADAIIFAVIAATIIRTFLFEAYTIPTSSMEKTLLIGDFLFVSKVAYGPRVPETPIAFPFAHHTLPLTNYVKSYVEWIKLPYYRFRGYTKIKRNDVVVFNYPDGDTVALYKQNQSYYQLCRDYGRENVWAPYFINPYNEQDACGPVVYRPVDKRENYIKRCVAIPGDTLFIKNQEININSKTTNKGIGTKQYQYIVTTDGSPINPLMIQNLDITDSVMMFSSGKLLMTLTDQAAEILKLSNNIKSVVKICDTIHDNATGRTFPYDKHFNWTRDNFGPMVITAKGMTVNISLANIALYDKIIVNYELNKLEIKGNKIFINGKESTKYTFKMNYYWMMGDNRHNSADSRYWGFVPEDHIVGKAVFVWLSLDKNKSFPSNIRWNKMFRMIH